MRNRNGQDSKTCWCVSSYHYYYRVFITVNRVRFKANVQCDELSLYCLGWKSQTSKIMHNNSTEKWNSKHLWMYFEIFELHFICIVYISIFQHRLPITLYWLQHIVGFVTRATVWVMLTNNASNNVFLRSGGYIVSHWNIVWFICYTINCLPSFITVFLWYHVVNFSITYGRKLYSVDCVRQILNNHS